MFFIILLCLFAALSYTIGECKDGCNQPILLYETLKCRPIYASPNHCCPKQFDCPHIIYRDDHYCYFKGRTYRVGENINDDEIYGNCLIDCTCVEKRSGGKGFGCAILDCAEWVGLTPKSDCYFKYELNKCCSTNEVCPPFDVTCEVNGQIYNEGQHFVSPNDKCTECVCERGFNGIFDAPFCKKTECLEEITNALDVKNFCAPSYFSSDDCCPIQWICPKNDNIRAIARPVQDDPTCKFGHRLLNIGDTFERTHSSTGGKVFCKCIIPPYVTCIQDEKYPVYAGDYH